jgi:hypothetical protein
MPVFTLYFKADLENVDKITFPKNHEWKMDFQNTLSDEIRDNVSVIAQDISDCRGSRDSKKAAANVDIKFKYTGHSATISIVDIKGVTRNTYTSADDGAFIAICAFECRGAFPVKWNPTGFYIADDFDDVDLSDKEWYEVNAETSESMSITNVEWRIERQ